MICKYKTQALKSRQIMILSFMISQEKPMILEQVDQMCTVQSYKVQVFLHNRVNVIEIKIFTKKGRNDANYMPLHSPSKTHHHLLFLR